MDKKLRILTVNAILAACYVVITALFSSFSFGVIQIRISTALYQLVAYDKKFYWGMVLGVILANLLFSPFGLLDIFVGLGVTGVGLAIAILINQNINKLWIKAIVVGICVSLGMIFVAWELHAISKVPFWMTYLYLFLGQIIAQIIGYFVFVLINRKIKLENVFRPN